MKRIFDGYQQIPKNVIRFSCVRLCGTRVTGPLNNDVFGRWRRRDGRKFRQVQL